MGWLFIGRRIVAKDSPMILVDTSVIVAWMDSTHPQHTPCWNAIRYWAGDDELAISSVTYAELAAGARTREGVDEDLSGFARLELDFASAWRAGHAFRKHRSGRGDTTVLPDFFIRAQAAELNLRHLTNDRRRLVVWPDVDFIFPER
jgi:predicted nucleic acid-binding protein